MFRGGKLCDPFTIVTVPMHELVACGVLNVHGIGPVRSQRYLNPVVLLVLIGCELQLRLA